MRSSRAWLIVTLSLSTLDACATKPSSAKPPPKSEAAASSRGPESGAVASSPSAVRECSTLIDTINPMLEELQRVSERQSETEQETRKDLDELGRLYGELHTRVDHLRFDTAELRGFVREYLAMIRKARKTMREILTALDERDVGRAEKAQERFVEVIALEDDLVDRINAFCQIPHETALVGITSAPAG